MSLENICRLCLYETPTNLSLLENNVHKMLETLTSINVSPNDEILMICVKCNLNLKLAYNIQQRFLRADERLKKGYLKSVIKQQTANIIKQEEISLDSRIEKVQVFEAVCSICNLILDKGTQNLHIQQHFNDTQLCDLCDQNFPNIYTYRKHQQTHSNEENYKCSLCQTTFQYKSLFNVHLEKAHLEITDLIKKEIGEPPPDEEIQEMEESAPLNFEVKRDLDDRIKKTKTDPLTTYSCEICLKKFAEKRAFRKHSHKKKTCSLCNKEVTAYNLLKHMRTHTACRQTCEFCGKTYVNDESLRGHITYQHKRRNKIYKCEVCGEIFKSCQQLYGHKKREHKIGTGHSCETCGREFIFSYDLKRHIKTRHLKERPFVCDFCNKGFSALHTMQTHRRQHTNESPYMCELCGEVFRQNISLRTHKKSKHNLSEASECKICGKGFSSAHAVKVHMKCH